MGSAETPGCVQFQIPPQKIQAFKELLTSESGTVNSSYRMQLWLLVWMTKLFAGIIRITWQETA
ncbi:unnamed protein product [Sphenostylis stenocarpa]|uniref:Uncharacterized protein n=1 Tax=Sphenostylis stenocarpa TaxID=92480 RepID=A0AA86S430_9FABA|nr:unnamed protein product [Sphenostylis stenocarpa]